METFRQRDYRVRDSISYLTLGTCKAETCIMLNQTLTTMALEGDLTKYGLVQSKYDAVTGAEKKG